MIEPARASVDQPFVEVAVAVPHDGRTATFHYAVPPGLVLKPGHLVMVPFGSRRSQGVVLRCVPTADVAEVRLV